MPKIRDAVKLIEADGWREVTTKGMHRFLIVIEKAGNNFSAYPPDWPGRVATGSTREETDRRRYQAIQPQIEGLIEAKQPVPASTLFAEFVVVPA